MAVTRCLVCDDALFEGMRDRKSPFVGVGVQEGVGSGCSEGWGGWGGGVVG